MKRKLLIVAGVGLVALLITGGAIGVALADQPTTGKAGVQQTFLSKFASALGVQEQQVKDAAQKAELSMIDDAVAAGKLTQDQANTLKANIQKNGGSIAPGNLRGLNGQWKGRGQLGRFGFGGTQGALQSAANFLGMKPADLMTELKSGKTLAQIATEHGKTADQMKEAIIAKVKGTLDQAVKNNKLTQDREDQILKNLPTQIDKILNTNFKDLQGHKPAPKSNQNSAPKS